MEGQGRCGCGWQRTAPMGLKGRGNKHPSKVFCKFHSPHGPSSSHGQPTQCRPPTHPPTHTCWLHPPAPSLPCPDRQSWHTCRGRKKAWLELASCCRCKEQPAAVGGSATSRPPQHPGRQAAVGTATRVARNRQRPHMLARKKASWCALSTASANSGFMPGTLRRSTRLALMPTSSCTMACRRPAGGGGWDERHVEGMPKMEPEFHSVAPSSCTAAIIPLQPAAPPLSQPAGPAPDMSTGSAAA